MGCTFEVLVPSSIPGALEGAEAALDEIVRLDHCLSVYRPDSEVSRLNAAAGLGPRPATESVVEVLSLAARLTEETGGAFDVAAGALARVWGLHGGERRVPDRGRLTRAMELTGMKHARIGDDPPTVELRKPGVELDFGAIGKGYALDRAAMILRERWGIASALLHGGTSSVFALGSCPGEKGGWLIGVRNPADETECVAELRLRDQGLATSAATHRFFEAGGKRWGHILDPRTGWPAEGTWSVTVVAPSAAEADALSTAFYVLGTAAAARHALSRSGVGAIFTRETGAEPVVQVVGDLEAEFAAKVRVERVTQTAAALMPGAESEDTRA